MVYKKPTDNSILKTLLVFGVPFNVSIQIIKEVNKWLSSSGPEFTVVRLKLLKQLYVNRAAGAGQSETWISCHKDGSPKGPFRFFFKGHHSRKQRTKALNALMIYSGIVLRRVTRNQWNGFVGSFERKETWTWPRESTRILKTATLYSSLFTKIWNASSYDDPRVWCSSPTKRTMAYDEASRSGMVSGVENSFTLDQHLLVNDRAGEGSASRAFEDLYSKSGYKPPHIQIVMSPKGAKLNPNCVGSISVIQERGCKGRFIANPYRVHQIALSRLGNASIRFLNQLSWDCTHDQEKGLEFCRKKLAMGLTAYCVDLSDATNNFPVVFQVELFKGLCSDPEYHRALDLFYWINHNGLWRLSQVGHVTSEKFVRCTQGQALGLVGSFPLFAATHGLILRGLERKFGTANTFVVLGDDVVIFERRVYSSYLTLLEELDVPISRSKCLTSSIIAEFAGKLIDEFGPYRVEKWKGFSLSDPLSLLRWTGIKGISLVPAQLRPDVLKLVKLPQPLGLGFNPEGVTLSKSLEDVDPDYLNDPGFLHSDKEAERELRKSELHMAFGEFTSVAYRLQTFEPPSHREEWRLTTEEQLEIEHINAVVKDLKYLPESFSARFEALQHKKKASTPSRLLQSTKDMFRRLLSLIFISKK